MKIRNGFVSNSSSSSFVVLLKKDIQHNLKEKVRTFLKETFSDFDNEENIVNDIYNKIEMSISSGREIYEDGSEYYKEINSYNFETIRDFFEENGLILAEIDTGSDRGVIKILGVKDYENIRKFMEVDAWRQEMVLWAIAQVQVL